ncbi:ABC-three component system protein [Ruegeria arenilitoris]|uniref:ABC-three component system protein n=1 Tax=Ruegeria arenilitoris TaxID=1173585 RepID=UPI00147FC135|nr:ABC-three component system protein [Ruegeria arenilitoris]
MTKNQDTTVNQSHSQAGGDIAGGSISKSYHFSSHANAYEAIDKLAAKLRAEVDDEQTVDGTIANLAYYKRRREAVDGIVGLECKLKAGKRLDLWEDALDQKVEFERLLEEWSLYASAQEIFAHTLAKIERTFKRQIKPHLHEVSHDAADKLIDELIVYPVVNECSKVDHFFVNANRALGMLYWLADRCFVRWHR